MLAVARTFALIGIEAEPVHVELDVAPGLPAFAIVGLPDAAVRESRERVRAALVNSDFEFPLRRITANLAPADLPKVGPGFDLAIAAALMAATGQLPGPRAGALRARRRARARRGHPPGPRRAGDGRARPQLGHARHRGRARGRRRGGPGRGDRGGRDRARLRAQPPRLADEVETVAPPSRAQTGGNRDNGLPDLSDLRGQRFLARALEIAAAGGHSLLMTGPPGAGKTLAARRLPSLLPPLDRAESLEVTRIAGACGERIEDPLAAARPFRAPHHTISGVALVGGGSPPRPGEVTRAHRGVLFLDELGEFRRDALESLRQPLEQGRITVARASRSLTLPCRFTLIAASNSCPCGRGPDSGECDCHPGAVSRYRSKLSGALADRIDIQVSVERPTAEDLAGEPGEGSALVRERVLAARERQAARLGPARSNAEMTPAEQRRSCALESEANSLLALGHERLGLSGRGWDRVIRVARTIADLHGSEAISEAQVAEALNMRRRHEDALLA